MRNLAEGARLHVSGLSSLPLGHDVKTRYYRDLTNPTVRPLTRRYYDSSTDPVLDSRRLVQTKSGFLCAAPPDTKAGDICVCLAPLLEPLILRPLSAPVTPIFDTNDEKSAFEDWASDLILNLTYDSGLEVTI